MECGANTQNYTSDDYDYGRSAGHYEAAIRAGAMAVEADDPAVKAALYALRDELNAKAEATTAQIQAEKQVTA